MAFVEAVARELFNKGKECIGQCGGNLVVTAAVNKLLAEFLHFLRLLFPHGPAKNIGLSEAESGDLVGDRHHLFLIDDDSIGAFQDGF